MSVGAAAAKPTLSLGAVPVVTKSRCWVSELNSESLDMKRANCTSKVAQAPFFSFHAGNMQPFV